jgi:hypothetical protein
MTVAVYEMDLFARWRADESYARFLILFLERDANHASFPTIGHKRILFSCATHL